MRPFSITEKNMATAARQKTTGLDAADVQDIVKDQLQTILDDDTTSFETLSPALESLFAEMGVDGEGESAKVFVSIVSKTGPEAGIWQGAADDYDLEALAKKFGSNVYRVKVYTKNAQNRRVMRAQKDFAWQLSSEDEDRLKNPVKVAPVTQTDIATAVAEAMKGILPVLLQHQAAPVTAINPMEMLSSVMTLAKQMMPAPAPVPAPVDPMMMLTNFLAMQREMREEMEDSGPSRSKAGPWDATTALINKFAPAILGLVQQNVPGMNMPQVEQAMPALTNEVQPTPVPESPAMNGSFNAIPQPTLSEQDMMFAKQQLNIAIGFLINGCTQGGNASSYAEMVIDNAPVETLDAILKLPDPYAGLLQIAPQIAPHEAWFRELLKDVQAILAEPPAA